MKKTPKNFRELLLPLNVFELSILALDTLTLKKGAIIKSEISSTLKPKQILVANNKAVHPYLLKRLGKQILKIVERKVSGKVIEPNLSKTSKKTRLLKQYLRKFKYFYSREYGKFYGHSSIKYNKKKLNTVAVWSLFLLSTV